MHAHNNDLPDGRQPRVSFLEVAYFFFLEVAYLWSVTVLEPQVAPTGMHRCATTSTVPQRLAALQH
jgi:hypothetical protein